MNTQLAQVIQNPPLGDLGSLSGPDFFGRLIPAVLALLIVVGLVIFVAYLIFGAISWITSGGDKMKVEQARGRIVNALTGVVILLAFFAILNVVEIFFGISLRKVIIAPYDIRFATPTPSDDGGGGGTPTLPPGETPTPRDPTPTPKPPGTSCIVSDICQNGFCSTDTDADGDTYDGEVTGTATGVCREGVGDCNDSTTDINGDGRYDGLDVHPGQSNYFEDSIPGTTNNFDYDCNDNNDKWPRLDCVGAADNTCFTDATNLDGLREETGFRDHIPVCGEILQNSSNMFLACSAYDAAACYSNPAVSNIVCDYCVTNSVCGYGGDQACSSWNLQSRTVAPQYVNGYERMPCK